MEGDFLVLEKITTLDKADVIARLFISYIFGHLTADEFRRFSDAVDQAFIDDINLFLEESESNKPFMEYLFRTGLTTLQTTSWSGGVTGYEISDLGKKMIEAYHQGIKYCNE